MEPGVVLSAISAWSNGVFAVGSSDHPVTNQTFTGSNILFLRRYDSIGDLVWTSEFSNSSTSVDGVSSSTSGAYVLTGLSLVGYSLSGRQLWSYQFSEPATSLYSVSVDPTGVFVSGWS